MNFDITWIWGNKLYRIIRQSSTSYKLWENKLSQTVSKSTKSCSIIEIVYLAKLVVLKAINLERTDFNELLDSKLQVVKVSREHTSLND